LSSTAPLTSSELEDLLADPSIPQEFWGQMLWSALKSAAPHDVFAYGEYVFRMRPAEHHTEMVEFILDRLDKRENAVILEPRGHAKTTWANTILLSYLLSKHPNLRVGLISNTAKQSNAFSRAVRFTIEANDYQHDVFGNLTGKHKWNDVEWIQKDSALIGTKDVNMYSAGAGGAIISKRFDLILCDDILDEENSANPEQREKVENWFWKTLKPCLAPGGSIIVIGTRWAEGDLYQQLIEDKKWPALVRGAIYYEPNDKDHLKPAALWPEMWPLDALERERLDMGSAMFACSYLNDISGLMAGNIFQRQWFQYFDPAKIDTRNHRWKMGVDLASSEKERADYTARVVISEDEHRNTYVWSVVRDKIETGHRQFVIDGYNVYPKIDRIVVENNQFQSALVKELLTTTTLPVVGKKSDIDKVTRARGAAARYESGKVFHNAGLVGSDFEIELLQFPKGHDDMIDALGHAMEVGAPGFFFGSFGGRRA
jgi:predicted phage terminase large subunit-like protein